MNAKTDRSRIYEHGFVFLSLLFLFLSPELAITVSGQPGSSNNNNNNNNDFNPNYARFSPSMAIIIVVLIAALFFMGFFSIYIRHCSDSSSTGSVRRALSLRARRAAAARGLEASVLETFPTFTYSEVKDHKIGKGALECAICLNEFEDDETLRLIPKCDHVFHPECIDAWLESHVTCPVCRTNLTPQAGDEPVPVPESTMAESTNDENNNNTMERTGSRVNQEVVIQIEEDQAQAKDRPASFEYPNRAPRSWSIRRPNMFGGLAKFRSHSTGHESLVQPGADLDRFTLRLPAGVRKEMMERASLNRTGSFAATSLPREGSSRRGYREGSSRGGRSWRRIDREPEARSDRWVFFTRMLSMRTRVGAETGEASTSKGSASKAPVKMPSFKCLEPKAADETGLVAEDSAKNTV